MQCIFTKHLPATNHRGTRIKVWSSGNPKGALTFSWRYEIDAEHNHLTAAQTFAREFKWDGEWFMGDDGKRGYVFVCSKADSFTVAKVQP